MKSSQSDSRPSTIPCLSLADENSAEFDEKLGHSLSTFGFVAFRDHGLTEGLRRGALEQVAQFFERSVEQKMRCHVPGGAGARGYTPFFVEVAKDHITPDLKEFFHVGRGQVRGQAPTVRQQATLAALPANVWPSDLPSFSASLLALYSALEELGLRILAAIARWLGLSHDFFVDKTDVGNSILRALHYPPLPAQPDGAVRAAAHEDINLITLLVGAEQPGLEVLSRSGQWIPAPLGEELIICNVGDMLERLTNHVLPSTTHRVVNPPRPWSERSRYSLPFFLHPNSDFLIQSLPQCVSADNPDRYPVPILADDFLRQRLVEIGLISRD